MKRPASVDQILKECPSLLLEEIELLDGSRQGALFSQVPPSCDFSSALYRYVLWRLWGRGSRFLVAMMLNPSTATHLDDDNTINRMTTRSFRLGYDGLLVINAFAWRDTLPKDMRQSQDPVGPDNDRIIDLVIDEGDLILCGWGVNGDHLGRAATLAQRLEDRGIPLYCLGRTKSGHPEHPLYLPFSREPTPWSTSYLMS